ncbi:uncharacterized protein BT62DRAFT_1004954 [Guyanagaster necrorhizus]|uniref:F-box domain-containing protein n=1 Tax=Guyanagaster necrorhizus TaxID=856835 RepID=A0A9P8AUX6_9AGAR|nr:uncharacterized protein BT62DRAFT_1004954 [Guyanagaster necrorhizus MCA 3950]KAG7447352.1 hypothetical protein BT62DRAFT_1004954 [Guyanagaster necrorhizus MCA 3950]
MDPVASLGKLDILPIELLDIIVSQCCDIQTVVTSLSLVNRCARVILHSSFIYQRLRCHADRALVAMLRTKVASYFTLADVDSILCGDPYCTRSGDFGPPLWLPECCRCCMSCLRGAPDLSGLPISRHAATKALGISKSALARLPTYESPYPCLSFRHARAAAVKIAGGEAQFMARISVSPWRQAAYDAFIAQTRPWDNVARYMVAAPLPYFDKRFGKVDRGIHCLGCQRVVVAASMVNCVYHREDIRRRDTVYVARDFIHHI